MRPSELRRNLKKLVGFSSFVTEIFKSVAIRGNLQMIQNNSFDYIYCRELVSNTLNHINCLAQMYNCKDEKTRKGGIERGNNSFSTMKVGRISLKRRNSGLESIKRRYISNIHRLKSSCMVLKDAIQTCFTSINGFIGKINRILSQPEIGHEKKPQLLSTIKVRVKRKESSPDLYQGYYSPKFTKSLLIIPKDVKTIEKEGGVLFSQVEKPKPKRRKAISSTKKLKAKKSETVSSVGKSMPVKQCPLPITAPLKSPVSLTVSKFSSLRGKSWKRWKKTRKKKPTLYISSKTAPLNKKNSRAKLCRTKSRSTSDICGWKTPTGKTLYDYIPLIEQPKLVFKNKNTGERIVVKTNRSISTRAKSKRDIFRRSIYSSHNDRTLPSII